MNNIETFAKFLVQGFSFGPSARCVCCHQTNTDTDEKYRGFCDRCFEAIEALKAQERTP